MRRRLTAPSWRAWRVWRRNGLQSLGHWHTNVLPPMLEPLLYLLAFGAGVGGLVGEVDFAGRTVPYIAFIAPALVVVGAMFQSFFENAYSSFVRMYYQRIWDAMTATPLSLGDILVGEALWGATRGVFAGLVVLAVVTVLGYVPLAALPAMLAAILVTAGLFAVLGLLFTSVLGSIDAFNYPVFLLIMPMFLFGETFFPVAVLPGWAQTIAHWTPLYGVMQVARPAALGSVAPSALLVLLAWAALLPVLLFFIHRQMARRLID
jgi:lipooligosaccharide transport system permease protein